MKHAYSILESALRRARLALGAKASVPVVLKGALWLQGEADAKPGLQPTCQERLVRMIDDLRAELAALNLPFIAATIGEFGGAADSRQPLSCSSTARCSRFQKCARTSLVWTPATSKETSATTCITTRPQQMRLALGWLSSMGEIVKP